MAKPTKAEIKKDDDLLMLSIQEYQEAIDADKAEREQIDSDTKFAINYEGCQWPKEQRTKRENENPPRPCLVNNKIPEKIDQVDGEFRQMQPSVKVRPVDSKADPKIAEIFAGMIRHIEYNSDARSAYNTSHTSVLYGGRGAWRIDLEDAEDDPFTRDIKINRLPNVLTVVDDPFCKKQDRSDRRFLFITDELPEVIFKERYPDVPILEWDADDKVWQSWRTEETVMIAEKWWKETEKVEFLRIKDLQGNVFTERADKFNEEERARLDDQEDIQSGNIIKKKMVSVDKVKWALMTAGELIPDPETGKKINDWPGKHIPIVVEHGKEIWIDGKPKTRGMVRFGVTPQQLYNYFITTNAETVTLAPKAPYVVTAQMIGKYLNSWQNYHIKAYPYLLFDPDPAAPQGPQRTPPIQLNTAYVEMANRMEHDIMAGMGIYQASLGDEGQEKSGKAILAKQRQGNIGSYAFTDGFQVAYIYSMKVIIDLIPYVYDSERIMRIRGEDDSEKTVPINALPGGPVMSQFEQNPKAMKEFGMNREGVSDYVNDLTVGKYDIVATLGPSYTTQREESTAILMDLLSAVPQIGQVGADLLVKTLDFNEASELAERIKKSMPDGLIDKDDGEEKEITPQMVQQAVEQAVQQALEQFAQSAEGQKLQAEVTKAQAAAQVADYGVKIEENRLAQQQEQSRQYGLKVEQEDLKAETQAIKLETEEIKKETAEIKAEAERILGAVKIEVEGLKAKAASEQPKEVEVD